MLGLGHAILTGEPLIGNESFAVILADDLCTNKGQNILSTLKGLTILKGKQHVDHNTLVNHSMPNCDSHQDYKGIYSEQSKGVFNGKIYVNKIAQKTSLATYAGNSIYELTLVMSIVQRNQGYFFKKIIY